MRLCSLPERWRDKQREDHRIMPENDTQRAVTQPVSFAITSQRALPLPQQLPGLSVGAGSPKCGSWIIGTSLPATLPPHKILLRVQSSKVPTQCLRESWCREMGCSDPDVRCEAVQRLSEREPRKQDRHISSVLCPP